MFSNLIKNALKIFKLKKRFKIIFLVAPNMVFGPKKNYNFFSTNDLFAQITILFFL